MDALESMRAVGATEAEGSMGIDWYHTRPGPSPRKAPLTDWIPVNEQERAAPAGFGEKMQGQIDEMAECEIHQVFSGRCVGPVDQQRLPFDIFAGHKAPIAAVGGVVAIVAHSKKVIGWHNDFTVHHVMLEHVERRRR